jgi:hypothetical protein
VPWRKPPAVPKNLRFLAPAATVGNDGRLCYGSNHPHDPTATAFDMFTIRPLRDLAEARFYYQVLSESGATEHLVTAPPTATLTSPRWHSECRGLSHNVTEYEFLSVCASRDVRAAYAYTFSPSLSISQAYERLLRQHDWHHSQIILQAIETAANDAMQKVQAPLGLLVWAASAARWHRRDRQGVSWNAVLLDISDPKDQDRRERRLSILRNTKHLYSTFTDTFTETLTNAWPQW